MKRESLVNLAQFAVWSLCLPVFWLEGSPVWLLVLLAFNLGVSGERFFERLK